MKILGHVYVALKSVPAKNKNLLVWGSILPEMTFYIEDNPFDYEEIHEGGIRVLDFLKKEKSAWTDLALGILSHSSKFGADHFDEFKQLEQLGYVRGKDAEFEQKVAEAINLTSNLPEAQIRVHNLLDLALDLYISRTYPKL